MNLILIVIVVLVVLAMFGGGVGYYGGHSWAGPGLGVGGIILFVLIIWLLFGRS